MAPNLHRSLAHSPAALDGYVKTAQALAGGTLAPRLREQIALATAGRNGCRYCASAHHLLGGKAGIPADELHDNIAGDSADPAVRVVLEFVAKLIDRQGRVDDADFAALREVGHGNAEIVEIIAHVGMNIFTNYFNNAVGTVIDFPAIDFGGHQQEMKS
ncbi:MAG: carboxymuconolactone decarboxylase family protein [Planctomycetes bacterium]|nr:carboxymuconolactone decarboxylase family protein [Planctomycetota bacterium]